MSSRALPISPPVFAILSALIEERFGVFFAASDSEVLAEKVSPRALALGFDSLLDYYYFLRYDPNAERELERLAEVLVINETYFRREADQLEALVGKLLPNLLQQRPSLRIWSAACSTGEEPLTLCGMMNGRDLLPRVQIVASDISQRALAIAQNGRYSGRSLRAIDPSNSSWLDFDGRIATVKPALRECVTFRQLNLTDTASIARLGQFDVILCRNVLIYFRDATIKQVVQALSAALTPGGYLLVGASESLLRLGTDLICEEHGGAFFYRKVAT
jgi:chemotaxis protein methyltransferase CheR